MNYPLALIALITTVIGSQHALATSNTAPIYQLAQSQSLLGLNIKKTDGTFEFQLGALDTVPGTYDSTLSRDGIEAHYKAATYLFQRKTPFKNLITKGNAFALFKEVSGLMMVTANARGNVSTYGRILNEPILSEVGGMFYVTKGTRELVLVDSQGLVMITNMIAPALKFVGGNFYIDQDGKITTFRAMGMAPGNWAGMPYTWPNALTNVVKAGGNYFVNQDGSVQTIGTKLADDGSSFQQLMDPYQPDSAITVHGGNYFITTNGTLYTIDSTGVLFVEDGEAFKVAPALAGYSYFIMKDGSIRTISAKGTVHKELVMVTSTGDRYTPVERLNTKTIVNP